MKIVKLCTYENIQLENVDGSRPRGAWARLQKTFTEEHFDITLKEGIGVTLQSKEDGEKANTFIIPFANIPYMVVKDDQDIRTERRTTRGRGRPKTVTISESEDAKPAASATRRGGAGGSMGDEVDPGDASPFDRDGIPWV